ncbi:hypothetical protein D9757_011122 [Collybiopsis confluens]|uniref:Uncharacterized protein n=1 Tax=Collybiopsis confluens TaxID=2823264 RepID=A0A8H5GXH1_9AGAR|nr:hypothetical protein D9757_011122 [Collybiopsis confluens]
MPDTFPEELDRVGAEGYSVNGDVFLPMYAFIVSCSLLYVAIIFKMDEEETCWRVQGHIEDWHEYQEAEYNELEDALRQSYLSDQRELEPITEDEDLMAFFESLMTPRYWESFRDFCLDEEADKPFYRDACFIQMRQYQDFLIRRIHYYFRSLVMTRYNRYYDPVDKELALQEWFEREKAYEREELYIWRSDWIRGFVFQADLFDECRHNTFWEQVCDEDFCPWMFVDFQLLCNPIPTDYDEYYSD